MKATDALYVYGVVRSGTPSELFAGTDGIDSTGPVRLIEADGVAAVASAVPLAEFDTEALELNLKNAAWLEDKVQAHNRVLAAAVGKTTVLPLRFGAIYRGEEQVRAMLGDRHDLAAGLSRLDGMLEFGVKAILDIDVLRARLAEEHGGDPGEGGGREYMLRRQLERAVDEDVRKFAASCAEASHTRLAAASVEARANPAQPSDPERGEMLLNGAYLVSSGQEQALRDAVHELEGRFGVEGVAYELTGPWPPYNFVDEVRSQ